MSSSTAHDNSARIVEEIKGLDPNRYATKKSIAQGMLDIALLSANASQLKYILKVGEKHEFYTLLFTMITLSIVLQVVAGVLSMFLGTYLDINIIEHHRKSNIINNICLALYTVIVAIDVIIHVFIEQN